jgi:surface antigen
MAKMDKNIKYPQPGMVFTMPIYKNGKSDGIGHIGFIMAINDDGTATVKDSNWSMNEKIKIHDIPIDKMTGFKIV